MHRFLVRPCILPALMHASQLTASLAFLLSCFIGLVFLSIMVKADSIPHATLIFALPIAQPVANVSIIHIAHVRLGRGA
jgi:hypothetical protein